MNNQHKNDMNTLKLSELKEGKIYQSTLTNKLILVNVIRPEKKPDGTPTGLFNILGVMYNDMHCHFIYDVVIFDDMLMKLPSSMVRPEYYDDDNNNDDDS